MGESRELAKGKEATRGKQSKEKKTIEELEAEYSIYQDWTPAIRIVAWVSMIAFVGVVVWAMETIFKVPKP